MTEASRKSPGPSGKDPGPSGKEAHEIAKQAERMEKVRSEPQWSALQGLAVFGMVGWAIAVPTLSGIFIGQWLDQTSPASFSWTLTLLVLGATVGCFMAWRWVLRS